MSKDLRQAGLILTQIEEGRRLCSSAQITFMSSRCQPPKQNRFFNRLEFWWLLISLRAGHDSSEVEIAAEFIWISYS